MSGCIWGPESRLSVCLDLAGSSVPVLGIGPLLGRGRASDFPPASSSRALPTSWRQKKPQRLWE